MVFFILFCLLFCFRVFSDRFKKVFLASFNLCFDKAFPRFKVIIFFILAITFAEPFFDLKIAFLVAIHPQGFFLVFERKSENTVMKWAFMYCLRLFRSCFPLERFCFGLLIFLQFLSFRRCFSVVFHFGILLEVTFFGQRCG